MNSFIYLCQVGVDPRGAAFTFLLIPVVATIIIGLLIAFIIVVVPGRPWALATSGVAVVLIGVAAAVLFTPPGSLLPGKTVVWDFTHGNDISIVGWPANPKETIKMGPTDEWAPHARTFERITILLPNRPKLVIDKPVDVFIDSSGGQVLRIKIHGEHITCQDGINWLRNMAQQWGWPWQENTYQAWAQQSNVFMLDRIGASDRWNSPLFPFVGCSLNPAVSTSQKRPVYPEWFITWSKDDRP